MAYGCLCIIIGNKLKLIALLFAAQHEQLFSQALAFERHDSVSGMEQLLKTVNC